MFKCKKYDQIFVTEQVQVNWMTIFVTFQVTDLTLKSTGKFDGNNCLIIKTKTTLIACPSAF